MRNLFSHKMKKKVSGIFSVVLGNADSALMIIQSIKEKLSENEMGFNPLLGKLIEHMERIKHVLMLVLQKATLNKEVEKMESLSENMSSMKEILKEGYSSMSIVIKICGETNELFIENDIFKLLFQVIEKLFGKINEAEYQSKFVVEKIKEFVKILKDCHNSLVLSIHHEINLKEFVVDIALEDLKELSNSIVRKRKRPRPPLLPDLES